MKGDCFIYFEFNFYYLIVTALDHIFYIALVYILVCLSVYKLVIMPIYLQTTLNRGFDILWFLNLISLENFKWSKKMYMKRVLIITSHPDDECMFFGPVILSIQKFGCKVYLLCLSHGNYDKQVSVHDLRSKCDIILLIFFYILRDLKEGTSCGKHVHS